MRGAPTVGAALSVAARRGTHFNTGQRYWITVRGDSVWLQRCYARALDVGRQQTLDFALAVILKLIRLGAGPGWRPTEIRFEGPPPAHAERLASLAPRVRFGERNGALNFPHAILALPLPAFAAPRESGRQTGRGGALPSPDLPGSLRQTIDALLRLRRANLAAVADAAGTSVRSLQRQLATDGKNFHGLLEQARCRAACRMLAEDDRKVIEISISLGYSDAANFTRAFRRWTGVSPQQFRRASLERPMLGPVAAAS